ncbi:LuxR C-terminal-related transcriptional regulator [Variovorax sp. KK3]|uniref:LuxR C-terminal-related transcriptional regulator n=1 Tax=Variovorax sp. KK3 TaxID=1855728 RepID=UPI00097C85FA|nr:LuxR C-terminal-related transcriptional regulator [Variovorax sp. KK3]
MHTNSHIARAKIQAPLFRSGLIDRVDLEHRLGEAITSRRLVLLVAPAGYGKTAALSRQLQRLPEGYGVAWLTVDEEDDLRRLLGYLIEALDPLDPPWRVAPEALFDLLAQGHLREAASAVVTTLEATDTPHGVIVLDDLHTVVDPLIFEFLDRLLEHLPQNWTLVVATRLEPPLALARWRARREMSAFDETALSFSRDEVQALWYSATGQDDAEQAQRLHERTRGWAAGLCLSLEASRTAPGSEPKRVWQSRRHLFDYLASEIFDGLPVELQTFLMRCSLLAELTALRCEQMTGHARVVELMEDIERRRLFVSVLDSEELTLRLHDLFRDFLEDRLRRLHPEEVPGLLRQAAAGEADPLRRILMYVRAGAWDQAQHALSASAGDMLANDAGAEVMRIVEQFPADIQAQSPWLAYARGLCNWRHDKYSTVRSDMAHAAAGHDALGRHDDAQRARAMQALAMLFCGQMMEARQLGQVLRSHRMDLETETLCEWLDFWHENLNGPIDGPGRRLSGLIDLMMRGATPELWTRFIPRVNLFIGRPRVAAQIQRLIHAVRAVAGDRHWSLQANVNVTEAWLLLWQGRMEELEVAFERIEGDSHWLGQPPTLRAWLLMLRVMAQVICGEENAVRTTGAVVYKQTSDLDRSSDLASLSLAMNLRAFAAIGDWPTVRTHIAALEAQPGHDAPPMQLLLRTTRSMLALHEHRVDDALITLREVVANAGLLEATYVGVMARVHLARAELAVGSPSAAWQALSPLIERFGAGGELGPIMYTGSKTLTELATAPWRGAASDDGLAILRNWVDTSRRLKVGAEARPATGSAKDHAGLSERELEVLALLANGRSNKLIARDLDLSPHTIKRHVARILNRLDLASRVQAADWYRTRVGT